MRHYEEYTVETVKKHLLKITCDKCGAVIPFSGAYEARLFRLEACTVTSYPGACWKDGWKVEDLCDTCAEWLLRTLVAHGVTITHLDHEDCLW